MFDRTISDPDVPRPVNTMLITEPLVRPLITQLVAVVFLQEPVEELAVTD